MYVHVIDTVKPANGLDFPVVEAIDVSVEGYDNLADAVSHFATTAIVQDIYSVISNKANASTVADLQAQINQIVISSAAESVVAPEVAAARVAIDGTEYVTLKDRLDGQEERFTETSTNLYNSLTALEHTKLDGVGDTDAAENYFTSDYIPVTERVLYFKSIDDSSIYHRVCGYDSTNQFSGFATTDQYFTIPEGTHYIRICGHMTDISNAVVRSFSANDGKARTLAAQASDYTEKLEKSMYSKTNGIRVSKINGVTKVPQRNSYTHSGYIGIEELTDFDSYYFITDKDYTIWIDALDTKYFAILYGLDYVETEELVSIHLKCSGTISIKRSTNDDLPTVNNKLTIPRGSAVVFVVPHNADHIIYGIDEEYVFTDDFKENISSVSVDSVTDLDEMKCTANSVYTEVYNSQYADKNGMHDLDTYISFGLFIPKTTEIYTQSRNNDYFSICVYDGMEFRQGVRYRYYESEDTLPYENTPLTVYHGQYVVFTVKKDSREFAVILSDIQSPSSFKSTIPLADSHINQVLNRLSALTKDCYLRYVEGSGSNYSTERVEIYVPTGVGYVEYEFVHSVRQAVNSDVWRMAFAYACDDSLNHRFALTTSGEWECAVHLEGRSDFSGGIIHGDEALTNDATFFIDGGPVDITNYTSLTSFNDFVVVESTELYDPNDSITVIAYHGSEHIFNKGGLKIKQSLLWTDAQELTGCYMAMHLPAKAVTDHMYTDNSLIPFEIETYDIQFPESKYAVVYGEESGVRSEFSIGEYPHGVGNGDYLLMTDNNGGAYNKCYYVITTESSISANTLWKTETNYKFNVNA